MSRLQFWFFASLGFVVLFGLSGCGSSEVDDPPQRGPGGPGGRGGGGFNLYSNETVAKELALTEDQKAAFKKISDDFRSSMQDMQDLDPQERRTKMQDIRKEMEDKNAAVLDDKQKNRMKEIRLQMQGTGALTTKEVADSLKLTDDQKKQIADQTKDLDEYRRAAFQDGGFNDHDVRDKLSKVTKEIDAKILAVLTPAQTASFDQMKGAKVEKLPQGGFGGGGFGGGGFGGGGFGGPGGGRGGRGGGGPGGGGGGPGGPGGGGPGGGAPPAGGRAQ